MSLVDGEDDWNTHEHGPGVAAGAGGRALPQHLMISGALVPFEKLAETLLKHVDGIANYCETKIRFGVVEAVNGNIRTLINRGRGYQNLRYMLLKAKRMAATNMEFIAVHTVKKAA